MISSYFKYTVMFILLVLIQILILILVFIQSHHNFLLLLTPMVSHVEVWVGFVVGQDFAQVQ